jgi:hypothetical protein
LPKFTKKVQSKFYMKHILLALPFLFTSPHKTVEATAQQSTEQTQQEDLFAAQQPDQQEPPLAIPPRHKTPEEIQQELQKAEARFQHALKLFNPWYTGPLITPSATMVAPGWAMWQPYIFFTDTHASYDKRRRVVDRPNLFSIKVVPVLFQVGVTPSVDATIIMSGVANWSRGHSGGGFNDITAAVGFLIQKEDLYVPKFKLTISQSFPTGKYQRLSHNGLGLDGTGVGAWQTSFTFAMGKVLFWNTLHPVNARFAITGTLSTSVRVRDFNVYGGGFGTRGTVHPGNAYNADLGLELSINQPWVLALDVVYNWQNRTTFHGKPGFTAVGTPASVGTGYSDQLSLAPAIEYNFNEYMGILWGVWFTVWGRNSGDFVSGIFSWYWYF